MQALFHILTTRLPWLHKSMLFEESTYRSPIDSQQLTTTNSQLTNPNSCISTKWQFVVFLLGRSIHHL